MQLRSRSLAPRGSANSLGVVSFPPPENTTRGQSLCTGDEDMNSVPKSSAAQSDLTESQGTDSTSSIEHRRPPPEQRPVSHSSPHKGKPLEKDSSSTATSEDDPSKRPIDRSQIHESSSLYYPRALRPNSPIHCRNPENPPAEVRSGSS